MSIIQFSNGHTVEFSGTPTQQDIESLGQQMGLHNTNTNPVGKSGLPLSTSPFNPNTPNSQFIDPNKPVAGTTTGSKFVGSLPKAAAETFLQAPAKLLTSGAEGLTQTIKTGGQENASGKTYHTPVGDFKSFQSEAIDRANAGQSPLKNIGQSALQIGAAGLDTIGTGALLASAPEKLAGLASKVDVRAGGAALDKAIASTGKQTTKDALDLVQPAVNKKLAINTLKLSGKETAPVLDEAGNVIKPSTKLGASESGLLKNVKANPTPQLQDVAKDVKGLISKNNSPIKNITNLNQEIGRISSQEIEPVLKANKTALKLIGKDNGGVIDRIKAIKPTSKLIKSDSSLNTTYNLVKDSMLEKISEQAKSANSIDSHGLWNARKAFDADLEDQFGEAIYNPEKNSAVKAAIRDVRSKVNDIIAENNSQYRSQIKKVSNMYTARDNIAENNYKILTGEANRFTTFTKNHPIITKAIKTGTGLAGLGIAGREIAKVLD